MTYFKEFKKYFWNNSFETLVALTCLNQSNTFSSGESLFALFFVIDFLQALFIESYSQRVLFWVFFPSLFTYFLLSYKTNLSQLRMQLQTWGGTVLVWNSWLEYPAAMPSYSAYISCLWNKHFFILTRKYLISRIRSSLLNRVWEGWDFLVHGNIMILRFVLDQAPISGIKLFKIKPMMGRYTKFGWL